MNDNRSDSFFKNMFKIGTPECAITFSVIAMILALLYLLLGFWKTLLIAALMLLGGFLGGVKNKKDYISSLINRFFPPKATVPYKEKNEEISRAIREARAREDARRGEREEEAGKDSEINE